MVHTIHKLEQTTKVIIRAFGQKTTVPIGDIIKDDNLDRIFLSVNRPNARIVMDQLDQLFLQHSQLRCLRVDPQRFEESGMKSCGKGRIYLQIQPSGGGLFEFACHAGLPAVLEWG